MFGRPHEEWETGQLSNKRDVLWVGWDTSGFQPPCCVTVADTSALIVLAEGDLKDRADPRGLAWIEELREHSDYLGPALIVGFQPARCISDYSIVTLPSPGHRYEVLPSEVDELQEHALELRQLTLWQLSWIRRWRCGVQRRAEIQAHTLNRYLNQWPASRPLACTLLDSWGDELSRLASDVVRSLDSLRNAVAGDSEEEIRSAMAAVGAKISQCEEPAPPCPAPSYSAPFEVTRVMIIDNENDHEKLIYGLVGRGYSIVSQIIRDPAEVLPALSRETPDIIIVDRCFPDRSHKDQTLNVVRNWRQRIIVIAISAAVAGGLPPGVLDATGLHRREDADYIHDLIWSKAGVRS